MTSCAKRTFPSVSGTMESGVNTVVHHCMKRQQFPLWKFFASIVPHLEAKRVLRPISGIETAPFAFLSPTGLSKRELLMKRQGSGSERHNAQTMLAGLSELHSERFQAIWQSLAQSPN